MFARVNIIDRPGSDLNESFNALKDTVYAAMQQQKGFKNLYVLADNNTGKGYVITLWESEADLQAWLKSDAMAQAGVKLRQDHPNWPAPPPFEDYQVFYQA